MGEHVMVNGRELNFNDLPPEPEEYRVHVDGIGSITVEKGKAREPIEWVALALAKLTMRVDELEKRVEGM